MSPPQAEIKRLWDVLTYYAHTHTHSPSLRETRGFINCLHLPNNWLIPHQCLTNSSLPPFISFEQQWGNWNAQLLRKWAGESWGRLHTNRRCCVPGDSPMTDHSVPMHANPHTFAHSLSLYDYPDLTTKKTSTADNKAVKGSYFSTTGDIEAN